VAIAPGGAWWVATYLSLGHTLAFPVYAGAIDGTCGWNPVSMAGLRDPHPVITRSGDVVVHDTFNGPVVVVSPAGPRAAVSDDIDTWALSPDERRIVYGGPFAGLRIASFDGSPTRPLDPDVAGPLAVISWSSDERVTFGIPHTRRFATDAEVEPESPVWTVEADGTGLRQVLPGGTIRSDFRWSPSGDVLAFTSAGTVWTVRRDGSDLRRLAAGAQPAWSRDGRTLAFLDTADGTATRILTIDADGTGLRTVVTVPPGTHVSDAQFSPDLAAGDGGYRLAEAGGTVTMFGTACDGPQTELARVVAIAARRADGVPATNRGYWVVDANGAVRPSRVGAGGGFGPSFGDLGGVALNQPIVGIASTPSGNGYWLVAADGGVFTFGDAAFHGSTGAIHLNRPIVGIASTPSGNGYWLVAADGGVFSFGDAAFHGSTGAIHLNRPVVGMDANPTGHGYWLVAADGGIFSFGDAPFHGSAGAIPLVQPVVAMRATSTGGGYHLVTRYGGILAYGDAPFAGGYTVADSRTVIGIA
jgi:hypothetical protein